MLTGQYQNTNTIEVGDEIGVAHYSFGNLTVKVSKVLRKSAAGSVWVEGDEVPFRGTDACHKSKYGRSWQKDVLVEVSAARAYIEQEEREKKRLQACRALQRALGRVQDNFARHDWLIDRTLCMKLAVSLRELAASIESNTTDDVAVFDAFLAPAKD